MICRPTVAPETTIALFADPEGPSSGSCSPFARSVCKRPALCPGRFRSVPVCPRCVRLGLRGMPPRNVDAFRPGCFRATKRRPERCGRRLLAGGRRRRKPDPGSPPTASRRLLCRGNELAAEAASSADRRLSGDERALHALPRCRQRVRSRAPGRSASDGQSIGRKGRSFDIVRARRASGDQPTGAARPWIRGCQRLARPSQDFRADTMDDAAANSPSITHSRIRRSSP